MRQTIAFAAMLALVFACGSAASDDNNTADKAATAQATSNEVDGEKVYKQYCVTCHGAYGDMGSSGAFNLTESKLTLEERIDVITNGREGTTMVGFKSLMNEEKIEAVAKYIEKLRK